MSSNSIIGNNNMNMNNEQQQPKGKKSRAKKTPIQPIQPIQPPTQTDNDDIDNLITQLANTHIAPVPPPPQPQPPITEPTPEPMDVEISISLPPPPTQQIAEKPKRVRAPRPSKRKIVPNDDDIDALVAQLANTHISQQTEPLPIQPSTTKKPTKPRAPRAKKVEKVDVMTEFNNKEEYNAYMDALADEIVQLSQQQPEEPPEEPPAPTPLTPEPTQTEEQVVEEHFPWVLVNKKNNTIPQHDKAEDDDNANINAKNPLSHLGNYIETPHIILESYFGKGNHLKNLMRIQLESYNYFIHFHLQNTIKMFFPMEIHSENDLIRITKKEKRRILATHHQHEDNLAPADNDNEIEEFYEVAVVIDMDNFKLYPPQIYENNGATKLMTPNESRLRNFNYASMYSIDLNIRYDITDPSTLKTTQIHKKMPKINLTRIPIMTKSSVCVLTQNKNIPPKLMGECPMDIGGYFIMKGSEKVVLAQERASENKIYCFSGKNTNKWSCYAELKSIPDDKCISSKEVTVYISDKDTGGYGFPIMVEIPKMKQKKYVPLFVMFRAMGVISDEEICEYILLNTRDTEKQQYMCNFLRASIHNANSARGGGGGTGKQNNIDTTSTVSNAEHNAPTTETPQQQQQRTREEQQNEAIATLSNLVAYIPSFAVVGGGSSGNDAPPPVSAETIAKNANRKLEFTKDIIENDVFPHCKTIERKRYMLGHMVYKLLHAHFGWSPFDNRDSYENKRVDLTGTLLNNLFRNYFNKLTKEMRKNITKEIKMGAWRATNDYDNIINQTNICKIIKTTTIENGINRALSTGDFSVRQMNNSKAGVAQVLNRLNYVAPFSHARRVNTPIEKSGELIEPRKLHSSTWGFLCPTETPEGQSVGIVKNLSFMTHITIPSNSSTLYTYSTPFLLLAEQTKSPTEFYGRVKVFINGALVGVVKDDAHAFYLYMKENKYKGIINIYTSIVFDYQKMEIYISNDGGRMTRPLLRVKTITDPRTGETYERALITKEIIQQLESGELCWNDLLTDCKLPESVIEYIDPEEQKYCKIAMKLKDGSFIYEKNTQQHYTHCEIHPSTIFGVLASLIPFPEHNPAPRNTYQCAMGKQTMGVFATNHEQRADKTAYILTNPSLPLVTTRSAEYLQLSKLPSGYQVHIAIMTYGGFNQEDSVLLNSESVDRGLFMTTIYHTEKDEDKNIIRDEIIRCNPDPTITKNMKYGNYSKSNENGFIPENEIVKDRDILISKIVPIKLNKNNPTKIIKYEDQSKMFRTNEETYIQKNITNRNGEGYNFAKTVVRILRKPQIGDKFASRSAQKGTAGIIVPGKDMPFCANGLRPDIIINPHAIPSRMTMAKLKETLLGKILLELGLFGDGTSFGEITVQFIIEQLSKLGYESYGNELMYNGETGQQLESSIFVGPCYYQRLKHMVSDKQHARASGPVVNLTRQPAGGRAMDGGFRIGEMERDVMLAHGISRFCRDRMYVCSDKYGIHVCKKCGLSAIYNDGSKNKQFTNKYADFTVYKCNTCDNTSEFSYVEIPYSMKLLTQELQTINIVPRFITE